MPATVHESSGTPGFRPMLPGLARNLQASQNIDLRIAMGINVMPLCFAVRSRVKAEGVGKGLSGSLVVYSLLPNIPVFEMSSFLSSTVHELMGRVRVRKWSLYFCNLLVLS